MSARAMPVESADPFLTSLIAWFESPDFGPSLTMPDFGQQLMSHPIADPHGVLARTNTLVHWETSDTHPDWLLRIGQAAKILAANVRGHSPRQVTLSVRARRAEAAPTDALPELVMVEGGRKVAAPVVPSAPPIGFSVLLDVTDSRLAPAQEASPSLN